MQIYEIETIIILKVYPNFIFYKLQQIIIHEIHKFYSPFFRNEGF